MNGILYSILLIAPVYSQFIAIPSSFDGLTFAPTETSIVSFGIQESTRFEAQTSSSSVEATNTLDISIITSSAETPVSFTPTSQFIATNDKSVAPVWVTITNTFFDTVSCTTTSSDISVSPTGAIALPTSNSPDNSVNNSLVDSATPTATPTATSTTSSTSISTPSVGTSSIEPLTIASSLGSCTTTLTSSLESTSTIVITQTVTNVVTTTIVH